MASTSFEPEAFGKYYLVDKIATGGMAEIFKAKTYSHGGFENLLVIKRILAHLGDNEEFVEMFIDEAKVSVALQHANIIRIYDFGKILENYFIAMECVDGKDVRATLRKLAKKRRFLPIEFAAYIAHETCKGLYYAHTKTDLHGSAYQIVHRDISPSNILISYEGECKIADFGIAKAQQNTYSTKDGVLKGKFEYMSPEQANGEEIDHRSDIFSLGIILYEMLTGRRLFKTASDVQTLEKIKKVDIQPPSALNARVPERLERIVMKALARRREDRYQTAKEMQDDLLEFLFPATPDAICQSLARFMQALFTDEITEEVQRLEAGSRVAEELREQTGLPPDHWDGTTQSTMAHQGRRRRLIPLLLLALLFMTTLGVIGIGVAITIGVMNWPTEVPPEEVTTGVLDITVLPEATVFIDGKDHGVHKSLTLEDMEPGTYAIRLTADDHEPVETQVTVEVGETERVIQQLKPIVEEVTKVEAPPPEPKTEVRPSPAARPALVRFETTPAGALVIINNEVKGVTPYTWRGRPGGRYKLQLKLDGYSSINETLSGLSAGKTVPVRRTFKKQELPPGTLSVGIIGGGWGTVYLDGKKLAKPAPLNSYPVAAGKHVVRVVNETNGLDYTTEIFVQSGKPSKVNAKPQ